MGSAAIFMVAAIITPDKYVSLLFLGLVYAGITLQQSAFIAVLLDIGREYVGGVVGVVNMIGSFAAFAFSVSFGYFVSWFGSYDLALVRVAVLLVVGVLAWLRLDASDELIPATLFTEIEAAPAPA